MQEISDTFSSVSEMTNEAKTAWEVDENRDEVETKLEEAIVTLEELEDDQNFNDDQKEKVKELRNDIQGVYDQMNRVSSVSEDLGTVDILTDLYLKIGDDVEITDFDKYGKSLYIVDKTSSTVYRYTPGEDAVEKVANSSEILKAPEHITIGDGYMFVYDEEVGVVTMDMNEDEPNWTFRIRPELSARTVGAVTDIGSFADNVYLLKKDEARVLKSFPAGAGYSYPEEYFRHGGFDKAMNILIDGNIYVLSNASEKIFKFFGGVQDTFSLSGFDVPLGSLCCGSTNLNDSSNLYVYDEENERIVVIEKGSGERHPGVGVMIRQYVYRGDRDDVFNEVEEIVVDVDERVVYVLDGTKLLRVLLEDE